MKAKKTVDFCGGNLFIKIIVFTIPILLSGVLQQLFNTVDMIVVGRFCGSSSLAAVGSTGALSGLILNLFMGLSVGSGIMISHAVGAGQKKEIDRILHTSVLASIIIGVFLAVVGVIICKPLLRLIDTPEDVIDKATIYMRIIFAGIPFSILYNFCANMLRSTGDSIRPLIYLIVAGITNTFLNVILVTLVKLDVAGVAIGTIVSQGISVLLILTQLIKGTDHLKLKKHKLHISAPHLIKIMTVGIPAGIQGTVFSISNTIIQSSINSFGTAAIAGASAAASIDGFLYLSMNSFYQSVITAVGQNFGARKHNRIIRCTIVCLVCAGLMGLILGFFARTFSEQLLSIYCPGDAEAIASGQIRLDIMGKLYFMCGFMEVLVGVLRGMGHSLTTMIVSILGVCGMRIVWIYTVFAKVHTLKCLYISYPVSWFAVILFDAILLVLLLRKSKKHSSVDAGSEKL